MEPLTSCKKKKKIGLSLENASEGETMSSMYYFNLLMIFGLCLDHINVKTTLVEAKFFNALI